MHKRFLPSGFTLVELMIVIAVVALLGLLTVFAFGNWRDRTANTEVKTALSTLSGALKNYANFNNSYPATVPSTYQPSDTVTISYTSTATTYCAQGTSTTKSSIIWHISNDNQTPVQGAC